MRICYCRTSENNHYYWRNTDIQWKVHLICTVNCEGKIEFWSLQSLPDFVSIFGSVKCVNYDLIYISKIELFTFIMDEGTIDVHMNFLCCKKCLPTTQLDHFCATSLFWIPTAIHIFRLPKNNICFLIYF